MPKLTTKRKTARTRKRASASKTRAVTDKRRDTKRKSAAGEDSRTGRRAAAIRRFVNKPSPAAEFYTDEGCWILEVCRDEAATIARARVAPGVTTKAHSLRGVVERYLIIEGRGLVRIAGKAPEEVGPGDVVTIPPQVSQSITNRGMTDLIFYCVCTPPFTQNCYKSLE